MSVMSVSTVTMPRGRAARARRLHDQVVAEGRRHAHADQPAAVAHAARLALRCPSRSAARPVRRHSTRRMRVVLRCGFFDCGGAGLAGLSAPPACRSATRNSTGSMPSFSAISSMAISSAQARRLARRAHRVAFGQVEQRQAIRRHAVLAGVERTGLLHRVLGLAASGRLPDQLSWPMAVILPSAWRRCGCAGWSPAGAWCCWHERRAAAPPSPAAAPCGRRAPPARVGAHEQLGAEAAADEGRHQAHVVLGDAQRLGEVAAWSSRSSGSRSTP
jgi:hypothetical protein